MLQRYSISFLTNLNQASIYFFYSYVSPSLSLAQNWIFLKYTYYTLFHLHLFAARIHYFFLNKPSSNIYFFFFILLFLFRSLSGAELFLNALLILFLHFHSFAARIQYFLLNNPLSSISLNFLILLFLFRSLWRWIFPELICYTLSSLTFIHSGVYIIFILLNKPLSSVAPAPINHRKTVNISSILHSSRNPSFQTQSFFETFRRASIMLVTSAPPISSWIWTLFQS